MSDVVFPTLPGLAWGVTKTPVWKTVTHESVSGMEYRTAVMTYPRYRISMKYEFLRAGQGYTELQQLVGFFNARRGSWDDFLWQDLDDYQATAVNFGTGDGATKIFTIGRSFGGFVEPVQDFIGTPSIYVNGVQKATPGDWTVSAGKVTFVTAPAAGAALTWTGQFYKRVRFYKDETEFEQFMKDLWTAKKVELITVKR
jgi:uncharacterized protein (TIGR02217 family)